MNSLACRTLHITILALFFCVLCHNFLFRPENRERSAAWLAFLMSDIDSYVKTRRPFLRKVLKSSLVVETP